MSEETGEKSWMREGIVREEKWRQWKKRIMRNEGGKIEKGMRK